MHREIFGAIFETNNGSSYLLDVNTGKFIYLEPQFRDALDVRIYESGLQQIAVKPNLPAEIEQQMQKAFQSKMISSAKPESIKHSLLPEDIANLHTNQLQLLVLELTEQCNCRCSYCVYSGQYEGMRQHSERHMSWNILEKSIRYFAEHSTESALRGLVFYGGEPLLQWDLLQKAVHLARSLMPGCALSITTNGTLLTEEIMDFLVEHDFSVRISLDGPKERHDKMRRLVDGSPTYDLVMNKLLSFYKRYPRWVESKVGLSTVIHDQEHFDLLFKFLEEYPWINLELSNFANIRATDPTTAKFSSDDPVMDKVLRIVGDNAVNGRYNDGSADRQARFALRLVERLFYLVHQRPLREALPSTCHPGGSCVPGARRLFVRTSGEFYPCERVSTTDDFCIGDIIQGIDSAKSCSILQDFICLNAAKCKQCWCLGFCTACLQWADLHCTLDEAAKEAHCQNHRNLMHKIVTKYLEVMERNQHAFDFLEQTQYM